MAISSRDGGSVAKLPNIKIYAQIAETKRSAVGEVYVQTSAGNLGSSIRIVVVEAKRVACVRQKNQERPVISFA
jgi:hypothetical protein